MNYRASDVHPCFDCSLPECDDHSRKCQLRKAIAMQSRHKKQPELRRLRGLDRVRYRIAFHELYAERRPGRNLRDVVAEVEVR